MAYLLTFRCYGTLLPGNDQGTNERDNRWIAPAPALERYTRKAMCQPEQILSAQDAGIALAAFLEVGTMRRWEILAAHVRTTHAHLIATDLPDPWRAIADFKAYATRALRLHHGDPARRYWARGGHARWLPTPEAIRAAQHYVIHRQGDPIALHPTPHNTSALAR